MRGDGAPLGDRPSLLQMQLFPLGPAGVRGPAASKPRVGFADGDGDQACARSARYCVDLLARHLLAVRTADRAVALFDPDFIAGRPRSLGGSKSTLKISLHHAHCREE